MATLLLDRSTWDLVLDARGNIALATDPYAAAQDAASAIKTFLGEVYFDTTLGVPWESQILAKNPPLALLKAEMVRGALTMPGVAAARCFLTELGPRRVGGQVQVRAAADMRPSDTTFTVVSPQGTG
jgi:hypothetical protein